MEGWNPIISLFFLPQTFFSPERCCLEDSEVDAVGEGIASLVQ